MRSAATASTKPRRASVPLHRLDPDHGSMLFVSARGRPGSWRTSSHPAPFGSVAAEVGNDGSATSAPQEALLEQSRAVRRGGCAGPTDRGFRAPHCLLAGAYASSRAPGPRAHRPRAVAGSTDQEVALPIHEFVTRYRRDVEMIMAATLEASAGLDHRSRGGGTARVSDR